MLCKTSAIRTLYFISNVVMLQYLMDDDPDRRRGRVGRPADLIKLSGAHVQVISGD